VGQIKAVIADLPTYGYSGMSLQSSSAKRWRRA
jgi:hypothetical protein